MTNRAPLKQRIHAGEILIGVNVPITSTQSQLETILGKDDYAFVWIDSQHAPLNEERLVEFCQMAEAMGVHVQLRIKHTRFTYLIGNILDLGPTGVEVPQVEQESSVLEAVDNFHYPQQGVRSWGGSARWGLKDHPDPADYMAWWNNTGVLWIQIESIHAVSNARRLAKPGVDCLSWGPMDLSLNRQRYPDHPFQTDDDCVRYTLHQLEGTDVKLMYRNYTADLRNKYIDMGATVLLETPKP
ncbi:MAG: aldolase/citrate lyase family protein [Chloroflexota bacterium]|nr:aldolase/citrate lyase family protein [Chloroflexota bacterium]